MAKSLSSFKERIKVNTHLKVKNYGKGRDYSGVVYSVNKTYFTVAREVSKKFYDEWSPQLRVGSFIVIDDKQLVSSPKYFALSRIYWQPARYSRVLNNDIIEFLSYPETLSNGREVAAPFINIPIGQPWLSVVRLDGRCLSTYW